MTPAQRCATQKLGAFVWMAAGLWLGACATAQKVEERTSEIRSVIDPRHAQAQVCAPKELARAEVLSAVALYESSRADSVPAKRSMDAATEAAKVVYAAVEQGGARCAPDSDFDGIPDTADACKLEPEDLDGMEDEDGCPEEDRDLDGVSDRRDRCATEPEDLDGFEDSDGCPDLDNDLDGVPDVADRCPDTPEDRDGFEDTDGCPDPDNDADGIADANDLCPSQPEDFDGDQDTDGCPDVYRDIVVQDNMIMLKKKVFFARNKDTVLSESFPMLTEVADVLLRNASMAVRIEGHTDDKGSDRHNLTLSQKRAEAVRRFLLGQGVPPTQMTAQGFGESQPIEDNRTEAGRAINRRVEFHIVAR
jgi:outer membrane protein OmpA-like peptidoglycan-associated protein